MAEDEVGNVKYKLGATEVAANQMLQKRRDD